MIRAAYRLGQLVQQVRTYHFTDAIVDVDTLIDDLVWGRIEVDYIHFEGPAFEAADNRQLNLRLVTSSLSPVVMFTTDGRLKVLDFGLAKLATDPLVSPATDPAAFETLQAADVPRAGADEPLAVMPQEEPLLSRHRPIPGLLRRP